MWGTDGGSVGTQALGQFGRDHPRRVWATLLLALQRGKQQYVFGPSDNSQAFTPRIVERRSTSPTSAASFQVRILPQVAGEGGRYG